MKKSQSGFTLIELVCTVAILGLLASMSMPSAFSYMKRVQKKTDIASARSIADAVTFTLLDDASRASFYKHNTMKCDVSVNGGTPYKLVIVAKIDAQKKTHHNSKWVEWTAGNKEAQYFCEELNATMDERYDLMYQKHDDPDIITDRYIVCYQEKNRNQIEVWAADSSGTGGNLPMFRLYPSPDNEYLY